MADNNANNGSRVYQQIEEAADYYPPEVYDELTFMVQEALSYVSASETWDQEFIPLTAARAPNGAKEFIVGILPPSSTVTGRYLDRSASIASITGTPEAVDITNGWPTQGGAGGPGGSSGGGGVIGGKSAAELGPIVTAPGYTLKRGSGDPNTGGSIGEGCRSGYGLDPCTTTYTPDQLWGEIYGAYKSKFGREPTLCELQLYTTHCWQETGGKLRDNNPGFIGNRPANRKEGPEQPPPDSKWFYWKPTDAYFKSYDTPQDGIRAFVNKTTNSANVVQAAQNCDVLGYLTSQAQNGYYGESMSRYYAGCWTTGVGGADAVEPCRNAKGMGGYRASLQTIQQAMAQHGVQLDSGQNLPDQVPWSCGFWEDDNHYKSRIDPNWTKNQSHRLKGRAFRFMKDSPYGDDCPLMPDAPPAESSPSPSWQDGGSQNAMQADIARSKSANKSLQANQLGSSFLDGQQKVIQETINALEKMRNTPPLRMLVNPKSFKVSSEKVIQDGNYTQVGPVVQHWGDNQDKIDGSGAVAGFYAVDTNMVDAAGPGLTRIARNLSKSYQNFMSLWLLYRNNGALYINVGNEQTAIRTLSVLGSVYIYYDNTLYLGSFDTFTMTESDDKPFSLEYSFTFTVRATFLLDPVREPQYPYGQQQVLQVTDLSSGQTQTLPETYQPVSTPTTTIEAWSAVPPNLDPAAKAQTSGDTEILKGIQPYLKASGDKPTPAPGKPSHFR